MLGGMSGNRDMFFNRQISEYASLGSGCVKFLHPQVKFETFATDRPQNAHVSAALDCQSYIGYVKLVARGVHAVNICFLENFVDVTA
jgi:hypothetical protein